MTSQTAQRQKSTQNTKLEQRNDILKDFSREKPLPLSEIEKSEKKISELEIQIADIDKKLLDAQQYNELTKDPNFFSNYELLKKQLENEMEKWEDLSEQLDRE